VNAVVVKVLTPLLHWIGPPLVAEYLASIDPSQLAVKLRPHLETVMERMPREWRRSFVLALRKLAEIAAAAVPDL
jgi:hypothetical protein